MRLGGFGGLESQGGARQELCGTRVPRHMNIGRRTSLCKAWLDNNMYCGLAWFDQITLTNMDLMGLFSRHSEGEFLEKHGQTVELL